MTDWNDYCEIYVMWTWEKNCGATWPSTSGRKLGAKDAKQQKTKIKVQQTRNMTKICIQWVNKLEYEIDEIFTIVIECEIDCEFAINSKKFSLIIFNFRRLPTFYKKICPKFKSLENFDQSQIIQ